MDRDAFAAWLEQVDTLTKRQKTVLQKRLVEDHAGMTAVYGLADPRTNAVRFVGTSSDPYKRLYKHRLQYGWSVRQWMSELQAYGHKSPELRLLEWASPEQAAEREQSWRAWYESDGLLNEQPVYVPAEPWTMADVEAERERELAEYANKEAAREEAALEQLRLRQAEADERLRVHIERRRKPDIPARP